MYFRLNLCPELQAKKKDAEYGKTLQFRGAMHYGKLISWSMATASIPYE